MPDCFYSPNPHPHCTVNLSDKPYLRKPDGTLAVTNEFEFVYGGNFRALTNPSSVIAIREREATQLPDGKWFRTYGFADGHSEIRTEPDGNFEAWEKSRLPVPPSNNP